MRLWPWLWLALALATGTSAQAHTRSQSHSSWFIQGRIVHAALSVAETETARLASGAQPDDAHLLGYLRRHIGVSAQGQPCPLAAARMVKAATGFRRAEFDFACPDARDMRLMSDAFTDLVPAHANFAQIQSADGHFFEQLLTRDTPSVDVSGPDAEQHLRNAGFLQFVGMGLMHIFTGVDHMAFLVGLVLISRQLRDLVFVITGFTLGHSLTLALAVTGIIRPHAEFIDALVALTIALIGAENLASATRRPGLIALCTAGALFAMTGLRLLGQGLLPALLLLGAGMFSASYLMVSAHVRDAGRLRLVVTLVFGLVHGFGFAADLLENRLPAGRLAELLLGFNLGVEIGQLALVAGLTLAVSGLLRAGWALPRALVTDLAAAALIGIGTCWFVQRSFA